MSLFSHLEMLLSCSALRLICCNSIEICDLVLVRVLLLPDWNDGQLTNPQLFILFFPCLVGFFFSICICNGNTIKCLLGVVGFFFQKNKNKLCIIYLFFELLGANLSQHSHSETPILRCLLQSRENPHLVETWQMFFGLKQVFF